MAKHSHQRLTHKKNGTCVPASFLLKRLVEMKAELDTQDEKGRDRACPACVEPLGIRGTRPTDGWEGSQISAAHPKFIR